ncbi:MAG: PD40 domain-containing protein, partial [Candidatus Aminicenantes bacterium]|nr:PD40 domain-containing protein [Candidatus Aminicenantes bacterium]
GISQIDVRTGDVKSVLLPNLAEKEEYRFNEWAPNGKSFYFVKGQQGPESSSTIYKYDFETRKRKKIHHTPAWATIFLSPNGRWLAFVGRGEPNRELKVIPASGGEERVLYRFNQGESGPVFLSWTPDSQYILFFLENKAKSLEEALCRIPLTGGDLEELGVLSINAPDHPNIHPNGHQIVFSSTGFSINYPEYWVMENFLPKK